MRERKRIIDEAAADLTVSIHLNSFTQDPSVCGAQVFYAQTQGSELLAKEIAANNKKIVVLDDGDVAGMGTHEQLLETCAVYQEIYHSQFPKEVAQQ